MMNTFHFVVKTEDIAETMICLLQSYSHFTDIQLWMNTWIFTSVEAFVWLWDFRDVQLRTVVVSNEFVIFIESDIGK